MKDKRIEILLIKVIETVKEELLNSLRKSDTVEKSDFNIQNITDQGEAIERIKTGNKNIIRIESILGQMLKMVKHTDLLKTLT